MQCISGNFNDFRNMQPLFYMRHASCDSPPPYAGQQYNWFQLLCEMRKHMVKEHMKQSVEYCFHDAAIENAVDDEVHTSVCDEELSGREIPGGCTLVPHWQQIAYWELQQGIAVISCKKAFLRHDDLSYIGTIDLKNAADKLYRHLKCGYYKEDMRNVQGWQRRARKEKKP